MLIPVDSLLFLSIARKEQLKNKMDSKTLDECFDHVYKLTLECGKIVKEAASKAKNIETKSHRTDYVTEYDKKVEEILMNGIKEKYPNHK